MLARGREENGKGGEDVSDGKEDACKFKAVENAEPAGHWREDDELDE